jgi:hypothetical protein
LNYTLPQLNTSSPVFPRDLLDAEPDWKDFCLRLSDDTTDKLSPLWWKNIVANAPLIRRKGSAYDRYRGQGKSKACVIIGASPALKDSCESLKSIQNDPGFILVATSSSLKFLLANGIKPRFVFMADGNADCAPKIDIKEQAQGITLIATTLVHPNSLKNWQGNLRFVRCTTGDGRDKEHIRLTKIRDEFPGGGTQFNAAVLFSYMVLQSTILLFVGNELSWTEQYYVDRSDVKDQGFEKFPWINIHGEVSYTNLSFIQSKLWLEQALGNWKGVFINATEAGILGSSKRYGTLPYILQMKLSNSIGYVRKALEQYHKEVN